MHILRDFYCSISLLSLLFHLLPPYFTIPFPLCLRPLSFPLIWRNSKSTWARFSCLNFLGPRNREANKWKAPHSRTSFGLWLILSIKPRSPDGFASLIGIKLDSFAFMNNWSGPRNLTDKLPPLYQFQLYNNHFRLAFQVWMLSRRISRGARVCQS